MPDTPVRTILEERQTSRRYGCWTWLGSSLLPATANSNVNRKPWYAHRYVLYLQGSDIPTTMVVDHICCY